MWFSCRRKLVNENGSAETVVSPVLVITSQARPHYGVLLQMESHDGGVTGHNDLPLPVSMQILSAA